MRLLNRDWIPTPLIDARGRPPVEIAPSARTGRLASIVVLSRFLWWVATMVASRLGGRGDAAADGRRFRLLLEDLGGLWIKLGQLLSLRVDLFPLEFCRELSNLQVRAVGFAPSEAMQIVEEDLGGPIARFFTSFDEWPSAAASIGQVHVAQLRGVDVRVAVKVQRPNLPHTFRQQFHVIRGLVRLVQMTGYRSHMRWEELIWELEHIMLEEMDCRFEASSTRRMRRNLKAHGLYVPKVFHATRRVLVTEYIDGVMMSDYIGVLKSDREALDRWSEQNGVTPRELGRTLVFSLLRQLIEDNLFHGDLHPGNIVLLRDNRAALIDFGTCSFSERGTLQWFRRSILALAKRNYAEAADLYLLLAGTMPAGVDIQRVRDEFLQALCDWGARTAVKELPYHDKSIAAIYNAVLVILYTHHCTMEWALLRIRRGLETLDASLIHLVPDCNYSEIADTYARQAAGRQSEADARLVPAAAATLARAAFDLSEQISEYTMFQAAILRRHVRVFQSASNKVVDLLSIAVGQLAVAVLLLTGLAVGIGLAQRGSGWVRMLGEHATTRLAAMAPMLDAQIWIAATGAGVCASIALLRLQGRLRRHERRAAEQVLRV